MFLFYAKIAIIVFTAFLAVAQSVYYEQRNIAAQNKGAADGSAAVESAASNDVPYVVVKYDEQTADGSAFG